MALPAFQHALGEVPAVGAAFQAQEELLGGGRTMDERAAVKTIEALDVVTITAFSVGGSGGEFMVEATGSKPVDVREETC